MLNFQTVIRKEDSLLKRMALGAATIYSSNYLNVFGVSNIQRRVDPKKVELHHNQQYRAYMELNQLTGGTTTKTKRGGYQQLGDDDLPLVYNISFNRTQLVIGVARETARSNSRSAVSVQLPIESLAAVRLYQAKDYFGSRHKHLKVVLVVDCDASRIACDEQPPAPGHQHELTVYMRDEEQTRLLVGLQAFGLLDPKGATLRGSSYTVALVPHLEHVALKEQLTLLDQQAAAGKKQQADKKEQKKVDEVVAQFDPLTLN